MSACCEQISIGIHLAIATMGICLCLICSVSCFVSIVGLVGVKVITYTPEKVYGEYEEPAIMTLGNGISLNNCEIIRPMMTIDNASQTCESIELEVNLKMADFADAEIYIYLKTLPNWAQKLAVASITDKPDCSNSRSKRSVEACNNIKLDIFELTQQEICKCLQMLVPICPYGDCVSDYNSEDCNEYKNCISKYFNINCTHYQKVSVRTNVFKSNINEYTAATLNLVREMYEIEPTTTLPPIDEDVVADVCDLIAKVLSENVAIDTPPFRMYTIKGTGNWIDRKVVSFSTQIMPHDSGVWGLITESYSQMEEKLNTSVGTKSNLKLLSEMINEYSWSFASSDIPPYISISTQQFKSEGVLVSTRINQERTFINGNDKSRVNIKVRWKDGYKFIGDETLALTVWGLIAQCTGLLLMLERAWQTYLRLKGRVKQLCSNKNKTKPKLEDEDLKSLPSTSTITEYRCEEGSDTDDRWKNVELTIPKTNPQKESGAMEEIHSL